MKKQFFIYLVILAVLALPLAACSSKNNAPDPSQVITQAAQLASQGSTMTALAKPITSTPLPPEATSTSEPLPSATVEIASTDILSDATEATSEASPEPIITQAAAVPSPTENIDDDCYKAVYSSEGPPDDYAHFYGTVSFTKTWRIFNSGTCAWTSQVYLVWNGTTIIENGVEVLDSAETFGRGTEIDVITDPILPGTHLTASVEFTAPATGNATYKVYYKLYGPGGVFPISGTSIWFIIDVTPP